MGLRDEINKQQKADASEKRYREEMAAEERKRLAEFDKAAPKVALSAALGVLWEFNIESRTLSGKKSERLNKNQPDTDSGPFWSITLTCFELRPGVLLVVEMKAAKHPHENRPLFFTTTHAGATTVTAVEQGKKPIRIHKTIDLAPYLKN